jgi:hypothetical protein
MARIGLTLVRLTAPLAWGVAKAALWALVLALTVVWKNLWEAADRIAEEWTRQAVWTGINTQLAGKLRWFFKAIAVVSLIVGWVLCAYLTVFLTQFLLRR